MTNNREGNGTPLQYSCLENLMDRAAWLTVVHGVAKSRTRLSDFTFTFHFHALEKEMTTHSSLLAWRIPGTVEPGGLRSMGSHRVRHNWSDLAVAMTNNFEHLLMYILAMYLLWRNVFSNPYPCLHWVIIFFNYLALEFFICYRYKFHIRYMIWNYFLPFCILSFYFLANILERTKVFNFAGIQFINFLFCCSCFWCHI